MAFAAVIDTESGDHYIVVMDDTPDEDEILEEILNALPEGEGDCVCSINWKATYPIEFIRGLTKLFIDYNEDRRES